MYGSTEPTCYDKYKIYRCTLPKGHHSNGNYGDDHEDEAYGITWNDKSVAGSGTVMNPNGEPLVLTFKQKKNVLASFSKKELVHEIYRRDMSAHHDLDDVITEFGLTREELEADGWDLDTHDCPCPKRREAKDD